MTKKDAFDLAVQYHAFQRSVDNRDDNGIVVWGELLLATQGRIGMALVIEKNTQAMIAHALKRLNQAKAA